MKIILHQTFKSKEQLVSFIEYLRVYTDSDGFSHFETLKIDLNPNDYAPPATPLNTSSQNPAQAMVFLELPVG
jgi:hypothetical protein